MITFKEFRNIQKINEEINIILHLIEEGYVDTYEDAEVIIENMSEGWKTDLMKKVGKKVLKKAGQSIKKSKAYKRVNKFIGYTALGALGVPLVR